MSNLANKTMTEIIDLNEKLYCGYINEDEFFEEFNKIVDKYVNEKNKEFKND